MKLALEEYHQTLVMDEKSGLILGLLPANERQRYFVSMSLIGWGQT